MKVVLVVLKLGGAIHLPVAFSALLLLKIVAERDLEVRAKVQMSSLEMLQLIITHLPRM